MTPKATADAVIPVFLFLAGCGGVLFLAFALLGIETHGRSIAAEENGRLSRGEE